MKKVSLNSVVLPSSASHLLALRQIKSYLVDRGMNRHFDLRLELFTTVTANDVIVHEILSQQVDIAAFSVYPWNVSQVMDVCTRLKAENEELFIVAGGPYITAMAEDLMSRAPIDLIVKGAGEDVFCRVLDTMRKGEGDFSSIPNLVFRKNGRIVSTAIDNYFDVADQHYDLDVSQGDYEIFYYETSRGCPFNCHYCTWNLGQKGLQFYPRGKMDNDLTVIFELPGVKYLALCDSDIFIDANHGLWLLNRIHDLNARRREKRLPMIQIAFEINPEFLNDKIIESLLQSPIPFNIISCGLQTIDEEVSLRHLNRRINIEKYAGNLRRLHERARETRQYGEMKKCINIEIIYGLPGDTLEGFKRTIDFLLFNLGVSHFICFHFEVLPGSYFWDHCEEHGLVYEPEPPHYLISSNTFSKEDIAEAQRLVFFMYLFCTVFKGILRFVHRNVQEEQVKVYEMIIEMMTRDYPEVVKKMHELYHHEDENETLIQLMKYQSDKKHNRVKSNIITDARNIVKQHIASL